ncbi:helix-turn-helix domain-containing protein [Spirillospora sp. NPDC048819]|uniref:IclR family transcriptional regulator n=1 Tax=Spirillospora sp. NPDC048819 TaxID=3155268 RepID=UPI0033FFA7CC
MARPAPSVERTVKLLKFLADHPKERFSLSDIARSLDFNKATCHAMLIELVNEGMLIRHPADKTYGLGPALVNLGTAAALDAHEALDIAKAEMAAIHSDLQVSCVAASAVGPDMVVMARKDVDRPLFGYLPVGNRSPIVPPYGKEFLAWAREAEVEAWLDRADPALSEEERAGYYRELNAVRLTGYHATTFDQAMMLARIVEMLHGLPGAAELQGAIEERARRRHDQVHIDPEEDAPTAIMAIRAPIFGPSGRIVLALGIGQFPSGLSGAEVQHFADRLVEGTRRVTETLHGNEPFPQWARSIEAGGRLAAAST